MNFAGGLGVSGDGSAKDQDAWKEMEGENAWRNKWNWGALGGM